MHTSSYAGGCLAHVATCERVEVRLRERDTLAFHDAIREDEDKGNNDALFFSLDYELPEPTRSGS